MVDSIVISMIIDDTENARSLKIVTKGDQEVVYWMFQLFR